MTTAERNEKAYDAAILGGGPASSTAATILSKAGHRVVVEKETFPRFHIGESLLPYNIPIFEEMGVKQAIDAAGFMPKHGARFMVADGSRSVSMQFGEGEFTEQPRAHQVERSKFDDILLRHAEKSGAEVREATRATGYEIHGDGIKLETMNADGTAGSVEAKWLIDASGVCNFTGNRSGVRVDYPNLKKLALFSHYEGAKIPNLRHPGDILIVRLDAAWCWVIPLSESRVSLGIVVESGEIKRRKMTPEALFEEIINDHPCLRQSFKKAKRIQPVHAVTDYSYMNREFVSDRLIRVGDAAGFLDPIFSSGVYLAMRMGTNAAKALDQVLLDGESLKSLSWLRAYDRDTRMAMKLYRRMIEGFCTREFVEVVLRRSQRFKILGAINALLAGRLDDSWKLRWRMALFYTIVRIQRRIPLVPRLKLT